MLVYRNESKKTLSERIKTAFYLIGINVVGFLLLLSFLFFFVFLGIEGSINAYFSSILTFLTGFYALIMMYSFFRIIFFEEVTENEVQVKDDCLIIKYPFPKWKRVIRFSEIQTVKFNKHVKNNKSQLILKPKSDDDLDGFIDLNSIKLEDWKELSNREKLPLLIYYDLEKINRFNTRFFFQNKKHDNCYILNKLDENTKIGEAEWLNYCKLSHEINLLGQVEYFNYNEDEITVITYTLKTKYKTETLYFIDGQLEITYKNNKKPEEIIKIANDLKCRFKKVW